MLGDSTQKQYPVVKALVSINKKGIVVKIDKSSNIQINKGDKLLVYMQQDVKEFETQVKDLESQIRLVGSILYHCHCNK